MIVVKKKVVKIFFFFFVSFFFSFLCLFENSCETSWKIKKKQSKRSTYIRQTQRGTSVDGLLGLVLNVIERETAKICALVTKECRDIFTCEMLKIISK